LLVSIAKCALHFMAIINANNNSNLGYSGLFNCINRILQNRFISDWDQVLVLCVGNRPQSCSATTSG